MWCAGLVATVGMMRMLNSSGEGRGGGGDGTSV